jgi:tripartite-type tricarboxylate transporter receptor subunit TctC
MYRTLSLVLTLIVGFTSFAHAQAEWPAAKPVTIIVPSSPGGGTDAYGRILAQALTEQLNTLRATIRRWAKAVHEVDTASINKSKS